MKKTMKILLLFLFILGIALLLGKIMSSVDEPKHEVISSKDNIELRSYGPMVVAEVKVAGERKEAISKGFKILADYIFGNNIAKREIGMTAPVTAESNEKLAMTAPVMQQKSEDQWKITFVMPEGYTLDTLPKPNASNINLISIPPKQFVVIQFSGLAGEDSIQHYTEEVKTYVSKEGLKSVGKPILAFYDPPWTLPFLRRNEVMIEVD